MSFTIRPFRNGGWEIDIVLTLPNGEKIRERRKAPVASKSDAKKWAQERERHLLQHGRPQRRGAKQPATEEKTTPTFAEFVPRYLADHVKANREKPTTQKAKRGTGRRHQVSGGFGSGAGSDGLSTRRQISAVLDRRRHCGSGGGPSRMHASYSMRSRAAVRRSGHLLARTA